MTEDNNKLPRRTSREKPRQGDDRQTHTDRKVRRVMRERQDELIHRELLEDDEEEYYS